MTATTLALVDPTSTTGVLCVLLAAANTAAAIIVHRAQAAARTRGEDLPE